MSKSRKAASSTALLLIALFTLTLAGLTSWGPQALAEGNPAVIPTTEIDPDSLSGLTPSIGQTSVPTAVYFMILADAIL